MVVSACGSDDLANQGFTLNLSPRDLPAETRFVRYVVLTAQIKAGGTIGCENFFTDPRESVNDYPNDIVDRATVDLSPGGEDAISIKDLDEAAYVFHVEVLDNGHNILACGCGEGVIQKGKKTNVRILLIDDCI
jgi:hypothetical protein